VVEAAARAVVTYRGAAVVRGLPATLPHECHEQRKQKPAIAITTSYRKANILQITNPPLNPGPISHSF
jgi:hypothetical protein